MFGLPVGVNEQHAINVLPCHQLRYSLRPAKGVGSRTSPRCRRRVVQVEIISMTERGSSTRVWPCPLTLRRFPSVRTKMRHDGRVQGGRSRQGKVRRNKVPSTFRDGPGDHLHCAQTQDPRDVEEHAPMHVTCRPPARLRKHHLVQQSTPTMSRQCLDANAARRGPWLPQQKCHCCLKLRRGLPSSHSCPCPTEMCTTTCRTCCWLKWRRPLARYVSNISEPTSVSNKMCKMRSADVRRSETPLLRERDVEQPAAHGEGDACCTGGNKS